jgi:hypothetical protein
MEDHLRGFARGEFLAVMDDEGRENEGDSIIAANGKMDWMTSSAEVLLPERPLISSRSKSEGGGGGGGERGRDGE